VNLLEAVVLGLTQGLTEFLPVSSSAHLRIVPEALGWQDPGASFTAVVQLGTVLAVVVAFRRDLTGIAAASIRRLSRSGPADDLHDRLVVPLVAGTIPIAVLGLLFSDQIETSLRSLGVIAAALLVGSAWLLYAIRRSNGSRELVSIDARDAGVVGLAQAAALVPGISRSGATIGAGLLLGLDAPAAARFSFLLSVPAVVLAGLFGLRDVGDAVEVVPTLVATAVAFVSGYLSIRWLLRLVGEGRLAGFVAYRCLLAGLLLLEIVL
jgi:undecaprenyl-diphosphatase